MTSICCTRFWPENLQGTDQLGKLDAEGKSTKLYFLGSSVKGLNRVLKKIFGPKMEEDGSWRILHNDELHSLYSSPNIVMVIKSRRLRWAGHVARMGRGEVFTGFWLGGPKARVHWEDLGVFGRITLR
jgi:hypothetical protein